MKTWTKVGWIAAGYFGALAFALAVVAVYIWAMDSPERQASSGMSAFSDSLLFLGVFGVASVPSTVATLVVLRSYNAFWPRLSIGAMALTATGVAALAVYFVSQNGTTLQSWSALAILRLLAAPFLAGAFILAGLFAPQRASRIAQLSAGLLEAALFGAFALYLLAR